MATKELTSFSSLVYKLFTFKRWEQVYILPTLRAIIFLFFHLSLILLSMIYQNNSVLIVYLILFSFSLLLLLESHFNMLEVSVEEVLLGDQYEDEKLKLHVVFKNKPRSQELWINLPIFATKVRLVPSANHENIFEGIIISDLRYGKFSIASIRMESHYPLKLFRAWKYTQYKKDFWVYPSLKISLLQNDFLIRTNIPFDSKRQNIDQDDFPFDLKPFFAGDDIRKLHWKKLAQFQLWITKKSDELFAEKIVLQWKGRTLDDLRILAGFIKQLEDRGIAWEIDLFPNNGNNKIYFQKVMRWLSEISF